MITIFDGGSSIACYACEQLLYMVGSKKRDAEISSAIIFLVHYGLHLMQKMVAERDCAPNLDSFQFKSPLTS